MNKYYKNTPMYQNTIVLTVVMLAQNTVGTCKAN